MAIKLFIVDFELIEKANLVISGLTAISGESGNGKTAVYNSIFVLANNTQGAGYIRRKGATPVPTGCRVGILFEDSATAVTFEKKTSPVYTLDSPQTKNLPKGVLVLDKAGRGPCPPEVAAAVNMDSLDIDGLKLNLNFNGQMSEPMLKKLTHQQLYKVAVKSFDGEKIQEAIGLCKVEQGKVAEDIKKKSVEIDVQKKTRLGIIEQLNVFNPLDELKNDYLGYTRNLHMLPVVNEHLQRRALLVGKLEKVKKSLVMFGDLPVLNKLHTDAQNSLRTAHTLMEYHRRRVALNTGVSVLVKKLAPYSGLIALESEYEAYILNNREIKTVVDLNNERLSLIEEKGNAEKKFSFYGPDFVEIGKGVNLYRSQKESLLFIQNIGEKRVRVVVRLGKLGKQLELLGGLPDFAEYRKNIGKVPGLSMFELKRNTWVEKKKALDEKLQDTEKELAEAVYMLENNICPACGQKCDCKTK